MKRIFLISLMILVMSALILGGCAKPAPAPALAPAPAPAPAPKVFEWRFQSSDPSMGTATQNYKKYMVDLVEKASGGRLKSQFFLGGELAPGDKQMEYVAKGMIEIAQDAAIEQSGIWKTANFIFAIPFNPRTAQEFDQFYYQRGMLDWVRQKYAENFNVYLLGYFKEPGYGIISRTPLKSLADLKGVKVRMFGLLGETLKKAGASVVRLAPVDIYTGLATGTVDAACWGTPKVTMDLKLHEVAKYWVDYNLMPSLFLPVVVNMNAWNSLPDDLKQILELAVQAGNANMSREFAELDATSLLDMKAAGVTVTKWSESDWAKMRAFAKEVLNEQAAGDADSLYFLEQYFKHLKDLGYTD